MKYLIIGNGIAAIEAANSIRANDREGEITLLTAEPTPAYYRTRLTDVLAGKVELSAILLKKKEWYEENKITCVYNSFATFIDKAKKEVLTKEHKVYGYDKLLLATGAKPFIPPIDGLENENVFAVRTAQDTADVMEYCKKVKSILVLGGGLLGIEAANSLLSLCENVTILESFNRILPRQLDHEGSACLENLLAEKGLQFIKDDALVEANENKAVLKSGRVIDAHAIIVSAGVRPNVDLARSAGALCGNGITVDEFMKTSEQDIFAAGDCTEFNGRCFGLWLPAMEQGKIAGAVMAGKDIQYSPTPTEARLKVAGISLMSAGIIEDEKAVVKSVSNNGIYKKLVIRDEQLIGAIAIGDDGFASSVSKVLSKKAALSTILF